MAVTPSFGVADAVFRDDFFAETFVTPRFGVAGYDGLFPRCFRADRVQHGHAREGVLKVFLPVGAALAELPQPAMHKKCFKWFLFLTALFLIPLWCFVSKVS